MPYEKPSALNKLNPAWLGWGLVVFAAVTTVWGVGDALYQLALGRVSLWQLLTGISFRLFPLIFAVLAALVINRQPTNLVGWLMAIPVIGGMFTFFSEIYFQNILVPPAAPSGFFLLMLWINNTSWTLFIFPIILIPLVFPDGRPPSPRWNWAKYFAGALLMLLYGIATFSREIGPNDMEWTVTNPIGFIPNETLDAVFALPWSISLFLLVATCVAALIVRYRNGTGIEKVQIKWVVYACAFFGVIYLSLLPVSFESDNIFLNNLFSILFGASLLVVPVGISIAILRYRLWDIDFIINRSLVYGALTVMLAAILGGSLFLISRLFRDFAGGSLVAVAVSASVFGAIFQPARRKLQRFVDRRFYNIQIDYQKTQLPLPSESPTQVLHGMQIGAYRDLELVGKGGMAEVYRSTHPALNVPVAIKILPEHLSTDAEFRKRFIREAEVVAGLEHPNIVRIFDSGEQGGKYYMVMEFLTGKDLDQLIKKNGRLSLQQALPLIRQIASALDYAHARGCVHRDIKPSNILLEADSNKDGRAVLTDFGIAKILDARTAMTRTGYMLGTFDYIAPEQIEESSSVNGRADIYSLGVMTYQMLTGELPFKQIHPGALLIAHLNQPPPDACERAPGLSSHVGSVIQQAMAKKPEERFASAGEFVLGMS